MAAKEALIEVLDKASSQDPSLVRLAEDKLKEWEANAIFYKELLNVAHDEHLALHVRWLSTILFKNGIDKYWRRTMNRVFTDNDKHEIRQALILSFSESTHQVFLQKAVVIGRIARKDLKSWPDLIPCLLQNIRSEDTTIQFNALVTLNHVIKNLVSLRLAVDRRVYNEVASGILEFVLGLWRMYTEETIKQLSTNQVQFGVENGLRMSLLTLKVLRKLVIESSNEAVGGHYLTFLRLLIQTIPVLLRLRFQHSSSQSVRGKVEKLIVTSMKVLLNSLERHPMPFINVLADALKMAIGYVFSCPEQDLLFEMFLVQSANLIKEILKTTAYKPPKNAEIGGNASTDVTRAHQVKQDILTESVIAQMCEQLVVNYFTLKPEELNQWENDPETYLSEETKDSSQVLIRPCAENLYLCLYYEYRQIFTGVLAQLVDSMNTTYNTDEPKSLLFREAVYLALGHASYGLFTDFDFDRYFKESLLKELSNSATGMKIVHRRILWLIGRWIDVSFSKECRDILYQVLIKFFDQKEDLVVRVTAACTLKEVINDCQFESKDISMYLKQLWQNLFRLLLCVEECDTKMHVLNVISLLIERTGKEMQAYTSELCDYLPHLWFDSEDHNMLRCVLVTTLARVVEALGLQSMKIHEMLLPIIQLSTDVKQPAHVYLLDDGLDLWLAVMENTTKLSEKLLAMFAVLPGLLEPNTDSFKTCINIMEAYVLLDALSVMNMHSALLLEAVGNLMGHMKDGENIILTDCIRMILVLLPNEGPVILESILVKIFKDIIDDEENPRILILYLSLLGTVIMQNSAAFHNLIQRCLIEVDQKPETVAAKLIDVWLEKVDFMRDDASKKLTAMVLVSMLPSNAAFINERFALILDTIVNALYCEAYKQSAESTSENGHENILVAGEINMGKERKKQFSSADFVNSTQLLCVVKSKLEESRIVLGDAHFHSLMETLDPVVAKQLMTLIA